MYFCSHPLPASCREHDSGAVFFLSIRSSPCRKLLYRPNTYFFPAACLPLSEFQVRHRVEIPSVPCSCKIFIERRRSDHCRIVRAVDRRRMIKLHTLFFACLFHGCAQCSIGRHTSGDGKFIHAIVFYSFHRISTRTSTTAFWNDAAISAGSKLSPSSYIR